MSVSLKSLYRVVLNKHCHIQAFRSGVVDGKKLIWPNTPYIMTGTYVAKLSEGDEGTGVPTIKECVELPSRPVTADTQRLLVFFPGGIGDVIALKPVLQKFKRERPEVSVAVVSTVQDSLFIGDTVSLYDYPVTETIANHYDAWVNIADMDRASVACELPVTFAKYVGVEAPTEKPSIAVDPQIACAMSEYIRDRKRPAVGIHIASQSHFRSIPPALGALTMMELVSRGCDCYVVGGPQDRMSFIKDGKPSDPPDHIYDMTQFLGPMEYYMGFLTQLDVLLTADTGALHIGGALSVPTLGVFGMTDGSQRTGYYPSVRYLQAEKECSPCERIAESVPCDNANCAAIAEIPYQLLAEKIMEIVDYEKSNADC